MRLALAGDAGINSGSGGFAALDPPYATLRWGLRDMLVKGYNSAINQEPDLILDLLSPLAHDLLRLALIITANNIA